MHTLIRANGTIAAAAGTARKLPYLLLGLLSLFSLILMVQSSRQESATMDELAHIPSGYGYVQEFDFRLNPEHPPLVKALAALPLAFLDPRFPTGNPAWQEAINGQWDMGTEFLYRSGNDADRLIQLARMGPMLLTVLLILMTYVAARRRIGPVSALLPAFLVAISPAILAHGHYVTTDVGAALGAVLAIYFFARMQDEPSFKNILLAGLAFGIAESLKFSMILLLPLFVIAAAVHWWLWRGSILRRVRDLILVGLIGYLIVIYPMYALFTRNYPVERQVSDTTAILGGLREDACGPAHPLSCVANADVWMAGNTVLRPFAEYLLGLLMVIQRADGGNTSYFLGEVSNAGSPWYFPVAYVTKETIPALLFVLLPLLAALSAFLRRAFRSGRMQALRHGLRRNFAGFTMLLFVLIYWYTSVRSPLNIGVRHILPTIPLMYILAAEWWHRWITVWPDSRPGANAFAAIGGLLRNLWRSWLRASLLGILLVWALFEALTVAPHFLSYYNQFAGGTREGYRIAVDSNYDWGQDLKRLAAWAEERPADEKIAVDYFGGGNPVYYLGDREVNWWSSRGNPANEGIKWLAVSIGFLEHATQPTAPGFVRGAEDSYSWLKDLKGQEPGMGGVPPPDIRIGTSIFLYEL